LRPSFQRFQCVAKEPQHLVNHARQRAVNHAGQSAARYQVLTALFKQIRAAVCDALANDRAQKSGVGEFRGVK
jgi:hypothetical protein